MSIFESVVFLNDAAVKNDDDNKFTIKEKNKDGKKDQNSKKHRRYVPNQSIENPDIAEEYKYNNNVENDHYISSLRNKYERNPSWYESCILNKIKFI